MLIFPKRGRILMDKRLYPLSKQFFKEEIEPIIRKCYSAAGRPQKVSDYHVFNAILYEVDWIV